MNQVTVADSTVTVTVGSSTTTVTLPNSDVTVSAADGISNIADAVDTTFTGLADNDFVVWDNDTGQFINLTAAALDIASAATLAALSGSYSSHAADGTIHFTQAAISITESQISDLGNYLPITGGTLTGALGTTVGTFTSSVADGGGNDMFSLDTDAAKILSNLLHIKNNGVSKFLVQDDGRVVIQNIPVQNSPTAAPALDIILDAPNNSYTQGINISCTGTVNANELVGLKTSLEFGGLSWGDGTSHIQLKTTGTRAGNFIDMQQPSVTGAQNRYVNMKLPAGQTGGMALAFEAETVPDTSTCRLVYAKTGGASNKGLRFLHLINKDIDNINPQFGVDAMGNMFHAQPYLSYFMATGRSANLVKETESMDNSSLWVETGGGGWSVTPNVYMAPNKTQTMDQVTQAGSTPTYKTQDLGVDPAGKTYTLLVYGDVRDVKLISGNETSVTADEFVLGDREGITHTFTSGSTGTLKIQITKSNFYSASEGWWGWDVYEGTPDEAYAYLPNANHTFPDRIGAVVNGRMAISADKIPAQLVVAEGQNQDGEDLFQLIDVNGTKRVYFDITNHNLNFDTTTGVTLAGTTSQKMAFWGATPMVQWATTGETVGYSHVTSTTVHSSSTWTGNLGTTAYTINDIVKALKTMGLLAQ